jgi:hypothetical protein
VNKRSKGSASISPNSAKKSSRLNYGRFVREPITEFSMIFFHINLKLLLLFLHVFHLFLHRCNSWRVVAFTIALWFLFFWPCSCALLELRGFWILGRSINVAAALGWLGSCGTSQGISLSWPWMVVL